MGHLLLIDFLEYYHHFFTALIFSIIVHWSVAQYVELRFFDDIAHPEKIFSFLNVTGNSLYLLVIFGLGKLGLAPDYLFVRYAWAVAVELIFYYIFVVVVFLSGLSFVAGYIARKVYWVVVSAGLCLLFYMGVLSLINILLYGVWVPYFLLGISMYFHGEKKVNNLFWQVILAVSLVLINCHAFGYISRIRAIAFLILCLFLMF